MLVRMQTSSGGGGKKTYELYGKPSTAKIELDFKPRIIMFFDTAYNGSYRSFWVYNRDLSETTFRFSWNGGAQTTPTIASNQQLAEVTDNSFTFGYPNNVSATAQTIAIE